MTDKERSIEYLNIILKNKKTSYFEIKQFDKCDVIELYFDGLLSSLERNYILFKFDKEGNLVDLY
jgi:hypothetical protein